MSNPGPPPVRPQPVSDEGRAVVVSKAQRNYLEVVDTFRATGASEMKMLRAMLGGDRKLADRFLATCLALLANQSDLLHNATPLSIVQSIKDAASLGLEPMTDDAAIVEYDGIAKLMPQWKGYLKRIRNSRAVVDVDCQIVYENDKFEIELGTNPSLTHVPVLPESKDGEEIVGRGDYRGAYAWALMPSGKYIIEWMTTADINYVRDTWGHTRSSRGKPLPWATSWGEMARKTVLRRLSKRLPAAAVDQLLAIEKAHDEAAEAVDEQASKFRQELDDVRSLALQAVGQLAPGPLTN